MILLDHLLITSKDITVGTPTFFTKMFTGFAVSLTDDTHMEGVTYLLMIDPVSCFSRFISYWPRLLLLKFRRGRTIIPGITQGTTRVIRAQKLITSILSFPRIVTLKGAGIC